MQIDEEVKDFNPNSVTPFVIETNDLTKGFGGRNVVEGVSICVPVGSIFGFLGPNGSGKTTTIRMILGLVFPDRGEISLLGARDQKLRRRQLSRVGAVVEGPGFYPYLSGLENLRRFSQVAYSAQKQLNPSIKRLTTSDLCSALERVGLLEART
ncbi:MAG: ATP-binding cassette domain-containing protein, partial [Candidatus Marsarchaeota archaeon]|nr:ATP-binding cassette domain-containing protein [Candidatus Marsarchaeota archaeon]